MAGYTIFSHWFYHLCVIIKYSAKKSNTCVWEVLKNLPICVSIQIHVKYTSLLREPYSRVKMDVPWQSFLNSNFLMNSCTLGILNKISPSPKCWENLGGVKIQNGRRYIFIETLAINLDITLLLRRLIKTYFTNLFQFRVICRLDSLPIYLLENLKMSLYSKALDNRTI